MSASEQVTPIEQHGTPTYTWLFILAQSLHQFLRFYERENPTDQHGMPIYGPSLSLIPAQSLHQFLQHCAHSSFGGRNETPVEQHTSNTLTSSPSWFLVPAQPLHQFLHLYAHTEYGQFGSGTETPIEQHGTPTYTPSSFLIPWQSLYQFLQVYARTDFPSSVSGHETPAEAAEQQDSSVGDTLSQSVLSQEVDAQPNEPTPSIPLECPVCGRQFRRAQERDRHLVSYLPHSIYCPSDGCPWTCRRQCDFKRHWKKRHSKTDQVPGKEKNEIYDPKEFVKSIVDGTPPVEVARCALSEAKKRLKKLGKVNVGVNVWGRKRKLDVGIEVCRR